MLDCAKIVAVQEGCFYLHGKVDVSSLHSVDSYTYLKVTLAPLLPFPTSIVLLSF